MIENIDKKVAYLEFIHRENNLRHHSYDEEMLQYEYVKNGDIRAIELAKKRFNSFKLGHRSNSKLRDKQYIFVSSLTLVTRFAVEGGMDFEKAYNASDLYIQKVDTLYSVDEISTLHNEMVTYFTKSVAKAKKENILSKPVIQCIDYIYYHLNESISVKLLAKYVGLNPSYLSTLFKRETGKSISSYITEKRMETAKNMLKHSNYSLSDIGEFLNFSSYSHFARVFRKYYNTSPKEYRRLNFRNMELPSIT